MTVGGSSLVGALFVATVDIAVADIATEDDIDNSRRTATW